MSDSGRQPNHDTGRRGPEGGVAGFSGNTTPDAVYQETERILRRAFDARQSILLDGPPGSGKTTAAFKVISETDGEYTYLTKREDLYEQAEALGDEFGVDVTIIPSPIPGEIPSREYCPSFDPDSPHYDPEAPELHSLGVRAGPLHDLLDLTCKPDCPYHQFWADFDASDHRALIGHYKHAHIPSVIEGRTVIIDEFPDSAFQQSFEDAPEMIGRFLNDTNGMPFDDWDDLIKADLGQEMQAYEWFAENGIEMDAETIAETDPTTRYDSITPFLTWAVLESEKRDNGFSIPWFNLVQSDTISAAFGELRNHRRVAIDHRKREIHLLSQPDLGDATHVIGLDGTPLPEQWQLVTGENLDRKSLFDCAGELNAYIHDTLGVTIKQTSDHLKPYHGGNVSANRDEAILYGVEVEEGQKPAVIAPNKALEAYEDAGILRRAKRSMNYANVLSSNAFKGESVGVILGAPHPGDATLKRWAAYFGYDIEGRGKGMAKTYGDFGDRIYEHFVHNQVLQAILRFGRGQSEATVYVNTAAMPDWLDIRGKVKPKRFDTANKREIADCLRMSGDDGATIKALDHALDISEKTIRRTLTDFVDSDVVVVEQDSEWPYAKNFRWSP